MRHVVFPVLGLVAALTASADARAAGAQIFELPTPSAASVPQALDVAADGTVFYAETAAGKIARVIGMHTTREYALPAGAQPFTVKIGSGGAVWYTDFGRSSIGRLDPDTGAVSEVAIPSGAAPAFLQLAADGSAWFSEATGVGRVSPSGVVTEWLVTLEQADAHIEQLSLDPAGNVWFTELNYDGVGPAGTNLVRRLSPSTGVVRAYPVPTLGGTPAGVQAAADGYVWVSEYFAGQIARLDPNAAPYTHVVVAPNTSPGAHHSAPATSPAHVTTPAVHTAVAASTHHVTPAVSPGWVEFPIPTPGANAEDMRLDGSGHVYFEEDGGMLGELDVAAHTMTEWPIPSPNSGYYNIALDGDDNVWFAEAAVFGPVPSKVGVLKR